jgi:hypothetical protein
MIKISAWLNFYIEGILFISLEVAAFSVGASK